MSCLYTSGFQLANWCFDTVPGARRMYLSNWSGETAYTADSTGVLTGGTYLPTLYKFDQLVNTSTFNAETTTANGGNSVVQTATLVIPDYKASTINLAKTITSSISTLIVESQSGRYFLLGRKNGMTNATTNGGVGQNAGDLNGHTINLTGLEQYEPVEVSSTFFGTLTVVN